MAKGRFPSHQYNLLRNAADLREFCFIKRTETDAALEQHLAASYVTTATAQAQPLVEAPADVRECQAQMQGRSLAAVSLA